MARSSSWSWLALRAWAVIATVGVLAAPTFAAQEPVAAPAQTEPVASYRIEATLDPVAKEVRGSERITYRNPSPDTLTEVWIYLYLNAFRSEQTAWMREATGQHRQSEFDPSAPGWMTLEDLRTAEGDPLPLPQDPEATIHRVPLPRPLPPGGTVELDARWTSHLPRVFARTGFAADDFFLVAQWYPKLSVYDRGQWETEPWHANAEFFHDFGNYDLTLNVPAGFVTGASGVRQGESQNADGTRTIRYRAEQVSDVAWTAWPGFHVTSEEVDAAGSRVQVELLLPPGEVPRVQRHLAATQLGLDSFSRWYGTYPWPKLTVVVPPPGAEGAGGMEYPSFVTTGGGVDLPLGLGDGIRELEVVTVHEIAHQWFPLQVRSNEAREAWLDEGFADYLTIRALSTRYGPDRSFVDLPFGRLGYATAQRAAAVLAAREPLALAAWAYPSFTEYGAAVYGKGSIFLLTLEGIYGEERFTRAVRSYADRWRWRHPTTDDLQEALEESLGESLQGTFAQFVRGRAVVEYRVRTGATAPEQVGDGVLPADVEFGYADGSRQTVRWDGKSPLPEGNRPDVTSVNVDPARRLGLALSRLDDARDPPDVAASIAVGNRWLGVLQFLIQALGQVG